MAMKGFSLVLVYLCLVTTASLLSQTSEGHDPRGGLPLPIHPLRPLTGSGLDNNIHAKDFTCQSWRLAIETYNVRNWQTPAKCESYIGHYMLGNRYREDSQVVVDAAIAYAETLNVNNDGKDVWVFDIDETVLSNLPYYAKHGFGVEPYNATDFDAWVDTGKAPALPESLRFYKKVLSLGLKVVFLTGRVEARRSITKTNLFSVGFHTWEKLLLKRPSDSGTALAIKSSKRTALEAEGYRIVGNIGDQWSDILGVNAGLRTFKLPDPMYYIS